MIRAIGIDPGTLSFDVCGLEGDHLFLDRTISSAELATKPEVLMDILQQFPLITFQKLFLAYM